MNVYLALFIQILISGGTHIVAKTVVANVDPGVILFLRTIISLASMMAILFLKRGRLRIDRADWPLFLLVGFLGVPINQYLYLYGMKFTTAANGALLYAATPTFVLLLSHFFLKEKITGKKTFGIALAFVGISIVIFEKGVSFSSEYTIGNLMILTAVIAWAFFTILGKKLIIKYGALRTTTGMMVCGTAIFFPFGVYFSAGFPISQLNSGDWMGILYLSLGTSVLGYLMWYYALSRIDTAKVAVFSNGQPIVATILSMIFLDYAITGDFVIGGLMTIAGVILTQLG
ncbi:MAG TPA: EamA family transporter [Bacteroidota bacterium]|nr:EamA family transporter [Bacteroidota bacterium]